MPEGDTIHYAANRIRPVVAGHVPDELLTPHPRFARAGWVERLSGRAVTAVEAHGKHLFLRFEGDLTIHSHLRMTGSWRVHGRRDRVPRSAWLVLRRQGGEVVQVNGPMLVDPWRPVGQVSDAEALAIVEACRPRMQRSALDGNQTRFRRIYGRAGQPCPRCGQWDDNRTTSWCPSCQT